MHPQPLVFGRRVLQLVDRVLDLLVLLAGDAGRFPADQYPVFGGTVQSLVDGQRLRFRHVEVALGRVGGQVEDVDLECRYQGAGCWVGL